MGIKSAEHTSPLGRQKEETKEMAENMTANIDLDAIKAEVETLSPEDIKQQLLDLRTKQRVAQKKYHNAEAAKAYRQKRAAQQKAVVEAAKRLGIYDSIMKEAAEKADEILAGEAAEAEVSGETEATE